VLFRRKLTLRCSAVMQLTEDVLRTFGMGRVFKVLHVQTWIKCSFNGTMPLTAVMWLRQNYQGRVNSIDFHRSEDLLVTAGEDDAIRLYNTQTGMEIKHLFSKKHGVCNLCYTHAPQAVVHASNKVCFRVDCAAMCTLRDGIATPCCSGGACYICTFTVAYCRGWTTPCVTCHYMTTGTFGISKGTHSK